MKRLLLTSIAMLFLATGTAHANERLPKAMLGDWRYQSQIGRKSDNIYFRTKYCGDYEDGIVLSQKRLYDGRPFDNPGLCLLDNIRQVGRYLPSICTL
jgi:hypothetical protein